MIGTFAAGRLRAGFGFVPTLALIAAVGAAGPVPALAQQQQGTSVQMSGLKQDPDEPVEVTSDALSVDQNAGLATFTGNVIVVQGTMRMTAPKAVVTYMRGPDGKPISQIDRIDATDGVTLTTPTEAAEGREAVYRPETGEIVMTTDVLLTQGPNSVAGQRLTVDVDTGTGLMSGGRVRSVFQSQPSGQGGGGN
ncbi:LptA/OstA family protein [Frigidibacter sp. MR17.24]|uniref:LptA/OstA family protein n=1 Tax=Frigidibacter sp. MR17.24 TaxID=3127345 RepID=UPI003012B589